MLLEETDTPSHTGEPSRMSNTPDLVSPLIRSLKDLEILNLVDSMYSLTDWEYGRKKFLWGNSKLLAAFQMTQEEWNGVPLNDGQSQTAMDYHAEIHDLVQVRKEEVSRLKTHYPKGRPMTSIHHFVPVQVQLDGWSEPRTLMLMEFKDVGGQSTEVQRWGLSEELLRYNEALTMIFDKETGDLEYENQGSRRYYQAICNGSRSLSDVFDSCNFADPNVRARHEEDVRALTLNQERIEIECEKVAIEGEGGGELWHRIQFIPSRNPATGRFSIVVNEYDITTIKQQADQLAASKSQQNFLAAVSHELKTPLHGIIGLAESLLHAKNEAEYSPQMRKSLEIIKNCGTRLSTLVDDILDAASAREGKFVVTMGMVNLNDVSEAAFDVLKPLCPKGVKMRNRVPQNLPCIQGDPKRINQILTNLLSNAIKFTRAGSITLTAHALEERSEVRLDVRDTGVGVPKGRIDEVWEPFKQVDMSTARHYEGTGLGLSLVKQMVEAHSGRVSIQSATRGPDRGTCVSVVLPMAPAGASGTHSGASSMVPSPASVSTSPSTCPSPLGAAAPFVASRKNSNDNPSALSSGKPHAHMPLGRIPSGEDWPSQPRDTDDAEQRGSDDDCGPLSLHADELGQGGGRSRRSSEGEEAWQHAAGAEQRASTRESVAGEWEARRRRGSGRAVRHHSMAHGRPEILSVDDSAANHVVIENSFLPLGYAVTTCMSASEALHLISSRAFLPDVILLDIMMPGMNGFELCSRLRELYPLNVLPIIVVSAKSSEADVCRGLKLGCNDFLAKPFRVNELSSRISTALNIAGLCCDEHLALRAQPQESVPRRMSMQLDEEAVRNALRDPVLNWLHGVQTQSENKSHLLLNAAA